MRATLEKRKTEPVREFVVALLAQLAEDWPSSRGNVDFPTRDEIDAISSALAETKDNDVAAFQAAQRAIEGLISRYRSKEAGDALEPLKSVLGLVRRQVGKAASAKVAPSKPAAASGALTAAEIEKLKASPLLRGKLPPGAYILLVEVVKGGNKRPLIEFDVP